MIPYSFRRSTLLAFAIAFMLLPASTSSALAQPVPPDDLSQESQQQAEDENRSTQDDKTFFTRGDYVHISSTAPRTASGHGWWDKGTSDATEADVTIQLQVLNSGNWISVGTPIRKRIKPGGGSANRTNARYMCKNTLNVNWRSEIDVDLVGFLDSSDKLYTPTRLLSCGA